MLQDLFNQPLLRGERRTARSDRSDADEGRFDPWLSWRPMRRKPVPVLSIAELAECTCPDICDRDHVNE